MNTRNALVLTGVVLALAACNSADQNRTTSIPPGVHNPTPLVEPNLGLSAPPAPAQRTPVPENANAAAPGTNATIAFNSPNEDFTGKGLPSKSAAPATQAQAVQAQQDAAQAPNTAAADAAKEKAMTGNNGLRMPGTAEDTSANAPRTGTLTKAEESTQMPKAGQVNNHSDTALEKDSGRPSTGSDNAKQGSESGAQQSDNAKQQPDNAKPSDNPKP